MEVIYKEAVSDPGPNFEFVLSDATVDSDGDIVDPNGWELSRFRKNPIALFGHSHKDPIGTWADVRVEGGKLKGRLQFAKEGTSARIDELRRLVEQRILRAVSVGFRALDAEPIDPKVPWAGTKYKRHELFETSLVSVPANPAALSQAKSLNISNDTLKMVFGEHAMSGPDFVRRWAHGKNAERNSYVGRSKMSKTLSQRIEDAQNDLTVARDALTAHIAEDDADPIVTEELSARIEAKDAALAALKRAETALAAKTAPQNSNPSAIAAPAISLKGRQKELSGLDLVVRGIVARGCSHFGSKPIEQVLEERYPGHEATQIIAKADQTIGTTTVSGWASEIVQTAYADFVQALMGYSIYPVLRDRGIALSFDGRGTVSIPSRTAGGAAGGFVAEGSPIRVGRITTAATTMTSKKLGVIVAFSRELAKKSTPAIESLVRQAILEDTAAALDPILLDATASSTARPAGLRYNIAAAATGYGGGDYVAVQKDFQALLAPFIAANAADNITVIMNPAQGLALAMMPGPVGNPGWFSAIRERVNIVESTNATANRLIALRTSDFVTAQGDMPEFDISEQATIHLEDTTPLEIVSGTGPTTADPVRSLWQTGTIGVRMMMDIGWTMRRSGMVAWIDGTSW
jgi:HK97 family phage major capsid protein/HK97 family phage prohead protease